MFFNISDFIAKMVELGGIVSLLQLNVEISKMRERGSVDERGGESKRDNERGGKEGERD